MGVVKQCLGRDFDQLHELVNEHKTLRNFLGHTDCDNQLYHYQTLHRPSNQPIFTSIFDKTYLNQYVE